jgi:hypothetical protein
LNLHQQNLGERGRDWSESKRPNSHYTLKIRAEKSKFQ